MAQCIANMFDHISISNFKSIKHIEYDSKKINLFIGEPNSGKTNLLEALAFFSEGVLIHNVFNGVFRVNRTADLYYDQDIKQGININTSQLSLNLKFQSNNFQGQIYSKNGELRHAFILNYEGITNDIDFRNNIKYYLFAESREISNKQGGSLASPYGNNLAAVLYTDKDFRKKISDLFREKGFRLEIRPENFELLLSKESDDILYSYSWNSVSETLRRVVFYLAVLETNKDAVLLLDEPEAKTFPFYTTYIAERIALDESNQFFITTHNPYLLSSIVSKAPKSDVAVFVTYMENFETKIKTITGDRLSEILDLNSDVFFNLKRLLAA